MKKITSEMLKNVGVDTEEFDETFPEGMNITLEDVSKLNGDLNMNVREIVDKLLPIDLSVEFEQEFDNILGKYSDISRKYYDKFNLSTFGYYKIFRDAMKETKEIYTQQTKTEREILDKELSEINKAEWEEVAAAIIRAFKNCKEIRCVGKTM